MAAVRSTAEIREGFLAYFEEKGHLRCPSASLVPRADDRSTLLTTAGMQPQMPYFLGREQPPAALTTTAQKCFRTPDIDELGLDQAAIDLWQRIGMPPERIVPLPSSENFWSVGGPGPCGPDSEIYFDWGEETGCGTPDCLPGCTRCERFLEVWNLVFMEYELHADGTLTPLPKQ